MLPFYLYVFLGFFLKKDLKDVKVKVEEGGEVGSVSIVFVGGQNLLILANIRHVKNSFTD